MPSQLGSIDTVVTGQLTATGQYNTFEPPTPPRCKQWVAQLIRDDDDAVVSQEEVYLDFL